MVPRGHYYIIQGKSRSLYLAIILIFHNDRLYLGGCDGRILQLVETQKFLSTNLRNKCQHCQLPFPYIADIESNYRILVEKEI